MLAARKSSFADVGGLRQQLKRSLKRNVTVTSFI